MSMLHISCLPVLGSPQVNNDETALRDGIALVKMSISGIEVREPAAADCCSAAATATVVAYAWLVCWEDSIWEYTDSLWAS